MRKPPIIAFLCLLILALFSCASEKESFEESLTPITQVDLEGTEWKYDISVGYIDLDLVLGYTGNTLFGDLAMSRMEEVEKKYNVDIIPEYSGFGTSSANAYYAAVAGTESSDAVQDETYAMVSKIKLGVFAGISTVSEYIDYTDEAKWGTRALLENVYWEDDLFAVVPVAWPELFHSSVGCPIVINSGIIRENNMPDPREIYENNLWTWDTFEENLPLYTYTDNFGNTVYSICAGGEFPMNFAFSNGGNYVELLNGKYKMSFYGERMIKGMERGISIQYKTRPDCFMAANSVDSLIDGLCVMAPVGSSFIYGSFEARIATEMEDFGILPWPSGPDVEPGYCFGTVGVMRYVTAIPAQAKDVYVSAMILNDIYAPLPGFETTESIIDHLTQNVFYDRRDAECYIDCVMNPKYTYFLEGGQTLFDALGNSKGTTSIQQITESYEDFYDSFVENEVIPRFEAIEMLWGE